MLLRKNVNPRIVINVGLTALAIASVTRYLIHRNGRPGTNMTDLIEGLMYGLAIGTMLLGVALNARRKRPK
jgi:hypothetical protein